MAVIVIECISSMNKIKFFKTFISDSRVGAVAPTSEAAIKRVCQPVDYSNDIVVVEYGPGNGVLTKHLLERISNNSRLLAIDTNKFFISHLKKIHRGDRRVVLLNDDARNISQILSKQNIDSVDYVISSIPFTFLPPNVRRDIVIQTHGILKPGGKFLIYQYSTLMKQYVKKLFPDVSVQFVPVNIPPMFIIAAVKE